MSFRKRPFTLLELMIGIVLIAMAASVMGLQIYKSIAERRFQTCIDRLFVELESCRRLALSSQADWIAILEKRGSEFLLQKACPEMEKEMVASWPSFCKIYFNREPIQGLAFEFSASGKISPQGELVFANGEKKLSWRFPELFFVFEQ